MMREIVKYVAECDTCQRIKADHLRPVGNLQPLSIPEWKWQDICMDFVVGLSRTSHQYDSIWVIVDHTFWEQLHDCLGTHLIHSSAYHPQTNSQTERVN
jgi:hypothetical protein